MGYRYEKVVINSSSIDDTSVYFWRKLRFSLEESEGGREKGSASCGIRTAPEDRVEGPKGA